MSTLIKILALLIFIALAVGFYLKIDGRFLLGNKIIGVSVLVGTFILLPLFLYHSWKGKDIKKYMLTDENMKKMNDKNKRDS
ncbi:MAG TPA: hypothetical protein VFI78_00095 [Salinimicrobium sp.]|nr:hypothetical protein [Salinimicrobium sp.]